MFNWVGKFTSLPQKKKEYERRIEKENRRNG
jgi:hypothetical protein